MPSYSFLDCQATIVGPGGAFPLGNTAGAADEGITISQTGDKDTMTIGADGSAMHSLHADQSGTVRIRLLKTSPTNALLNGLYIVQTTSSSNHGQNIIQISDTARGDVITCTEVAFAKRPDINYAKDAGTVEWVFNAGIINYWLGAGVPDVNG